MSEVHSSLAKLASNSQKYLTFEIADEVYGLEILKVKEIVAIMKITNVPLVPPFIKGVINLRGQVIPVVDIRIKFDMGEITHTKDTTIIIVEVEDVSIGFIVDKTSEVINIDEEKLSPAPKFGTGIDTSFLKSMAKMEDKIAMIVDLEKVFSEDELDSISSVHDNNN